MNMQPMKLNNIQTGFKRILLTVATAFMLGNGWAQDAKVLKGRIVNAEGEPIAGAVVNVAEASRIALSDKDGFFTLKNVKPADELYVSSVGYLPATAIAAIGIINPPVILAGIKLAASSVFADTIPKSIYLSFL